MFGNEKVLEHPFVRALAAQLSLEPAFQRFSKSDAAALDRAAAVGFMLQFFLAGGRPAGDFLEGATSRSLDERAGCPGFSAAAWKSGVFTPRQGLGVEVYRLAEWFGPEAIELMKLLSANRPEPEPPGRRPAPKCKGDFDAFWAAYPKHRHVAKKKAKEKYDKAIRDGVAHQTMMDGLARCRRSEMWTREAGKYVPHPTTWLEQGRWDDYQELAAAPDPQATTDGLSADEVAEQTRRRRQEQLDRIARRREGASA